MSDYALKVSAAELARYRFMAETARVQEAEFWTAAGIVPGARRVDLGCGPGAILLALADQVGPTGTVTGVDAELWERYRALHAMRGNDLQVGLRLPRGAVFEAADAAATPRRVFMPYFVAAGRRL